MVGTAVYQVGWSSFTHSKKPAAEKLPVHATLPPAVSEASRPATSPWMWKSGITLRQRSVGDSDRVRATLAADAQRLRCSRGTSFGRDVVPEVCSSNAISAPSAGLGATARPLRPDSENAPAAVEPDDSSMTSIPRARATARAGESPPASITTAFTPRSGR
jgi:hypothetical protein